MFTILVTFLTVIADQITKYFVCINMDLGETIPVIKNVVHLTYIINPGAAFGLFPHQDVLFLGIVMILLLAFAWLGIVFLKSRYIFLCLLGYYLAERWEMPWIGAE